LALALLLASATTASATPRRVRARSAFPSPARPGVLDAITDVAGVSVGYTTRIEDLPDGKAVRTGVTAILPRGRATIDTPVFAGIFALNGNGEMTGSQWVKESGFLEGPVLLTNTHSVGVVRDAAIAWRVRQGKPDASGYWWSLPVVAETWDGELNDINGFHVRAADVDAAIEGAHGGAIAEGNVGGGTGMVCHEFKCGTGTASRIAEIEGRRQAHRRRAGAGQLRQSAASCAWPACRSARNCRSRRRSSRATTARSSS
jgi:D-aminopeptidase